MPLNWFRPPEEETPAGASPAWLSERNHPQAGNADGSGIVYVALERYAKRVRGGDVYREDGLLAVFGWSSNRVEDRRYKLW
jgi:hypothetical protein